MNIKPIEIISTILYEKPKKQEKNLEKEKERKVENIAKSNKNHFDQYA